MSGSILTAADTGNIIPSEIQGGVDYGLDTVSSNTTKDAGPEDLAITNHQKIRKSLEH